MPADERPWVRAAYELVHEDSCDPARATKYRKMVRAWAERIALDAQRTQDQPVLPIAIPRRRSAPLDTKYATLAAVHDAHCPCDVMLSPWSQPFAEGLSDAQKAHELDLAESYLDLKTAVHNMDDTHQDVIQNMLADVGAGAGGKRKGGRKRRNAKELTAKQANVVELREVHNLTFETIGKQWNKTTRSVQQLYKRAKANPAYRRSRSVGVGTASPLHANTLPQDRKRGGE